MKIYRAVKTNLLRQKFGQANTPKELLPLYNSLGLLGHDGFDFGVMCQDTSLKLNGKCENVYCDIDGYATITYIQKDVKNGFGINALDQDGEHKHCWWHFDSINPTLKVGSRIESGDLLGVAGNTGHSTGAHLHRGLYAYSEQNNGYGGAIDPEPYYNNIFIVDVMDSLRKQIEILQKMILLFKQIILNK